MSGEGDLTHGGAADVLAQRFSLGVATWEVLSSWYALPGVALGYLGAQWLAYAAPEVVALFVAPADAAYVWLGVALVLTVWRVAWRRHDWASARVEAKRELAARLTGADPSQVEVTFLARLRHAVSNSAEGLAILASLMLFMQLFAVFHGAWVFGLAVNGIIVAITSVVLLPSLLLDAWRDDGSLDRARVETIYRAAVAQGVDVRGALSVQHQDAGQGGDLSMSQHAGGLGVVEEVALGFDGARDEGASEREAAEQAVEVAR